MDQEKQMKQASEENVLFGIVGAFLFSLVGGIVYVILSRMGYIAAISGLITVVCAIKGYSFFAKNESKKGVVISVIIAAIILVVAWYIGFCLDLLGAYELWFESGEVDYVPTFFEYLPYGVYDLTVNTAYFKDLAISLVLGAVGAWSYVANKLKHKKTKTAVVAGEVREVQDEEF